MPSLRTTMGIFVGLPLAVFAAAAPGCSSDSLGDVSHPCTLTSECNSPLACIFSRCHQQCNVLTDCPMGQRCVMGTAGVRVCQLPQFEDACRDAADGGNRCQGTQTCGTDLQCRDTCQVNADCSRGGQFCVSVNGASACYQTNAPPDQPTLMLAGIELQDGAVVGDASSGSVVSIAGDSGSDATAAGGDGASAGDVASDGTVSGKNDGSVDGAVSDGTSADATLDQSTDASMEAFVPNTDAGCLGFTPTNFDSSTIDAGTCGIGAMADGGAPDAHISSTCTNCLPVTSVTITQNDASGTPADLYVLNSLTIDPSATLALMGPRPVILAVRGAVTIHGLLHVGGVGWGTAGGALRPGPGGFSGVANRGPGAGYSTSPAYPNSLGGGASYCGAGGKGATSQPPNAPGGMTYGNPELSPLIGGSAGGQQNPNDGQEGPGGGAIQIASGISVEVGAQGAINAGGGGGNSGGGGGSGGSILLEAPQVRILGSLAANGGGGGSNNAGSFGGAGADATANGQPAAGNAGAGGNGSAAASISGGDGVIVTPEGGSPSYGAGGGGAGRIRINTASGDFGKGPSTIISPSMSPGTACSTQGTLIH
jgi:hypothetical protein